MGHIVSGSKYAPLDLCDPYDLDDFLLFQEAIGPFQQEDIPCLVGESVIKKAIENRSIQFIESIGSVTLRPDQV